jgi:hypothetical protein
LQRREQAYPAYRANEELLKSNSAMSLPTHEVI